MQEMKIDNDVNPEILRERMMRQTNLFLNLSKIQEENLTVEEFLHISVPIIKSEWPYPGHQSVSIKFNNQKVVSNELYDSGWNLTAFQQINESDSITVIINYRNQRPIGNEEQSLIEAVTHILASIIDRIRTRSEMAEKQQLLDKAYKLARIGTWEYDMITERLHWSDETKEVHGFDSSYVPDVENTIQLFKKGDHRDTFSEAVKNALEKYQPFDLELKIISGKGDERWIRATGEPEFENGRCVRFYGISQNVTNRKQAKEDLQLSERRFKALVQDGADMIAILDEDANFKYISPTSFTVLGIPANNLENKNALDFIHKNERERVLNDLLSLSCKERKTIKPFRFLDSRGNWRWIDTTLTNLTEDPAIGGYVANSRDITASIIRQEKMEGSLREKETLLTEIHHRINNNLSVITSLLQIHASKENNEEVINRLSDSITRIHAMASIHEQLYQSNNFSTLELTDRIRILALNIQNTFQTDTKVDIKFECDPVELKVNKALPCSLILNEVITNIFKYAFDGRDNGTIIIGVERIDNQKVRMSITDDGIGLPENFNEQVNTSAGLGLKLIDSLSHQLSADYYYDSNPDETRFILEFHNN
jgi:PAS domain S-box-containing protein